MNHKLIPVVAAFMILAIVFSMTTPITYAAVATIGPKLQVWTIPQDDQKREKGIILLGLDTAIGETVNSAANGAAEYQCVDAATWAAMDATSSLTGVNPPPICGPQDLMSQHKILITYNGALWNWRIGSTDPQPIVVCNFLEKDKVNVIPDPKTGKGKQGSYENLMTKMVDVSEQFVCKFRPKSPVVGYYESAGILDVYFTGPFDGHYIADTILVVTVSLTLGRTVIFGSDIQDICVLGWAVGTSPILAKQPTVDITKPDKTHHYIWDNSLGTYVGCEDVALLQRQALGILPETGQDPLSKV
jgi:hypothetical protein